MLPSRLFKFKNHGIPPPLRSLVKIHPSLSPSIAVQLRLRLQVASQGFLDSVGSPRLRRLHTSSRRLNAIAASNERATSSSSSSTSTATTNVSLGSEESTPVMKVDQEPRLQITFTCTVPDCSERSSHEFTKRSYTKGIVIVQCPGCKNRHLIADHLGWFKSTDGTSDGKFRTIEDMMRAKGESVTRGRLDAGGVVEYAE